MAKGPIGRHPRFSIRVNTVSLTRALRIAGDLGRPVKLRPIVEWNSEKHFVNKIKEKLSTVGLQRPTGNLMRSVNARVTTATANKIVVKVGVALYGLFVEKGTGIYGPTKSVIKPTKGTHMTFYLNGKWFKMRTVEGQRPKPFFVSTVNENAQAWITNIGRDALIMVGASK